MKTKKTQPLPPKRYTLRIGSTEGSVVAGALYGAISTFLSVKFGEFYPRLQIEQWPDDPARYTLSEDGYRIGMLEVLKVEE